MALARALFTSTYSSSSGGVTYYFDMVVDQNGTMAVRNIRGPRGLINDPMTEIPQSVLDDINSARSVVAQTQTTTQVLSGTLTFTGQTYQDVVIAGGVLNNTNYRVVFSTGDGMVIIAEDLATTGFRVSVAAAYGSVPDPKTVGYVVLVATQQASTTSGFVTITDADNNHMAVVFTMAMATANYRIVLSPDGLYQAYITSKTRTGFTINIGYAMAASEVRVIGYDVFV